MSPPDTHQHSDLPFPTSLPQFQREMNQLVDLNDGGGNGFKCIANWIEKNL